MSRPLANSAADARYYERSRDDVLDLLPRPLGRVLDVGCGAGASAEAARARGATSVVGIELVEEQAAKARQHMDAVHAGAIEDVLPTLRGSFDTILCLDVLEHLVDPYSILEGVRSLAATAGHLQVSVPNARQKNLAWDLMIRGSFNYTDTGHRDWTHLRWFTRSDLKLALSVAGWQAIRSGNSDPGPRGRLLGRLFGATAYDLFATQIYMTAAAMPDWRSNAGTLRTS